MRNFKKFLALVLATLMVISTAATVSAYSDVADDNTYAAAINALTEYKIVNGTNTELDTFSPDDDVLRFQMALMMARALEPKVTDWQEGLAVFTDVNEWYGAIAYAYTKGIVTGIGNGLFAPKNGIKYCDGLIMAVRALGYEFSVNCDPYFIEAYKIASEIGLTKNIKITDAKKTLTRAETAQLIYNMIKATPADGGATIEEKNFGVAGSKNITTVVVTATEKQAYNNATKPAEAGYVGVQVVVDGVFTGEVKYYPAALLGIDSDKIEDSFAHSFDLVNYNAKADTFDKVVAGLDPVVVNGTDVTIGKEKITVNGVAYYPVDDVTGAQLKNEIIVYAGGSTTTLNSVLVVDKNGNLYDRNNNIVGSVVEVNGTTLYLYDGKFHTENDALKDYGVTIPGSEVTYSTYTASQIGDLKNNYQISLFDDDRDGKYERATVATLYMDVYKPNNSNGEAQFGVMKDLGHKVTFTKTGLAQGNVITYTYNKDTKVVNVIDVLETKSGILTKINTSDVKANDPSKASYKRVIVTIDGKDYVLANEDRVKAGYVGAQVKYAGGSFENIAKDAKMSAVDWKSLVIGTKFEFVAYGDIIIAGYSPKATDPYDVFVGKEITGINTDSIVISAYINGVAKDDIKVSSVKIGDKEYVFSKLNIVALSTAVNAINSYFDEHEFFQARTTNNGTYSLTLTDYKTEYPQFIASNGTLKFSAGIADNLTDTQNANENALRTNSSTVFYFLGKDNSIKIFVGVPADGKTIDLSKVNHIYTNKLGFGNDNGARKYGISDVVVVDCGNRAITDATNFFAAESATTTVFLLKDSAVTYIKATADTLGLSGDDVYRAYKVDAINLDDASAVTTIYVKDTKENKDFEPELGKAYTVEKGTNIVKSTEAAQVSKLDNMKASDFTPARNWSIKGLEEKKSIGTLKLTNYAKYDLKSAPKDALNNDKVTYTVYYKLVNDNKTLIGIAVENSNSGNPATGKNLKVEYNAEYKNRSNTTFVANFDGTVAADKKSVTGTYVITDVTTAGQKAFTMVEGKKNPISDGRKFSNFAVTLNGNNVPAELTTAKITDGVAEFTFTKVGVISEAGSDVFATGNYTVTMTTDLGATITIYFNVK